MAKPTKTDSPTILIAEDDSDLRGLLALFLRQEGYRVLTAQNGKEALEKVKNDSAQIVVSDVLMPGMDGLELVTRIRQNPFLRNVYVILVSGQIKTQDRIRGLDSGADDYISKPVDLSEFLARIRVATRRFGIKTSRKNYKSAHN